jgi:hypothetical protein
MVDLDDIHLKNFSPIYIWPSYPPLDHHCQSPISGTLVLSKQLKLVISQAILGLKILWVSQVCIS